MWFSAAVDRPSVGLASPANVALASAEQGEVLSAVAFAHAHRTVRTRPDARVLLVTHAARRDRVPLVVVERVIERDALDAPPAVAPGGGHGDGEELDRILIKCVSSAADVAWLLNHAQCWTAQTDQARPPEMIVIDDVDAFVGDSHSRPDLADDATLSRLMLLLTLATAAAAHWGAQLVVVFSARSTAQHGIPAALANGVRTVLLRHCGTVLEVQNLESQPTALFDVSASDRRTELHVRESMIILSRKAPALSEDPLTAPHYGTRLGD
mmetsp:Transcript_7346/g.25768  ORF Transcript_7346/g.25768 Transcript_7346/m.25768 type:complete len:268 (-) Transcript_7346:609-1412(-)